jgi:hypothetical protein
MAAEGREVNSPTGEVAAAAPVAEGVGARGNKKRAAEATLFPWFKKLP